MGRNCSACQHVKRFEIDRRLAAGEPGNHIAHDYDLNPPPAPPSRQLPRSRLLHAIMKEVARGTAAVACLPRCRV